MNFFLECCYLALLALALQLVIWRICASHPAMWQRRSYLALVALVWSAMPLAKVHFVDEIVPPVDGLGHEMIARDVADLLHQGQYSEAISHFDIGNNAYRFSLGVFYAVTGASETVTYAINGALGLIGLTLLLATLCIQTNCRRLPLLAIGAVCLLPSGLLWTTANLKEGPILWGICTMLTLTVSSTLPIRQWNKLWPTLGFFVVALFRPHIAVAWLGAIGVGAAVGAKRFGLVAATGVAAAAGFVLISYLAPDLFDIAMRDGVSSTLSDRYSTLADNERLNGVALAGSDPVPVWSGLKFLLFRPTPFEAADMSELLVGAEVWLIGLIGLWNWMRIGNWRKLLLKPSILTQLIALILFGYFFSYMYNLGLAVRQRLMCFPAVLWIYFYPLLLKYEHKLPARRKSSATLVRQPRLIHGSARVHVNCRPLTSQTSNLQRT